MHIIILLMEVYMFSNVLSLNVHFKVNEGVPKNHRLGSIQDHIAPSILKYQNEIKFIIMTTDKSQYFLVNELSGEVKVSKPIDREILCHTNKDCKLEFTVNCLHRQNIAEIIEVTVSITDVNDNPCTFIPASQQTVSWREDSKIDETTEFINRPKDPDVFFSILQSNIVIKSEAEKFGLKIISTGSVDVPYNLELILRSELDYETKQFHSIIITASDGLIEHECTLNITVFVIDINDNSPKFLQDLYSLSIPENYPFNLSIIQLQATDRDSGIHAEVLYEIDTYVDQNVNVNFQLDQRTGHLYLKSELNYYICRSYTITIEARNVGMRSRFGTTKVLINVTDINNESPEIKMFSSTTGTNRLTIEENQQTEKDVAMVAVTDKDAGINAKVNCFIQNQTLDDVIQLRETIFINTFRLVVIKLVDRETIDRISALLVCHDLGQPSLTTKEVIDIHVLDQNDNGPVFHSNVKTLNIFEDSESSRVAMNFRIIRFQATDKDYGKNSALHYSIYSSDPKVKETLKIDRITGILSSYGNLDKEKMNSLRFTVAVSDSGDSPRVSELDFELNIDDFNDHAPRFSEMSRYNFQVCENRLPGVLVGIMYAKDMDTGDNARLSFSMESSLTNIPFALTTLRNPSFEKNGQFAEFQYRIDLKSTKSLDRESIFAMNQIYPKYDFIVRAEDNGNPKLTHRISVQIDVLDENDMDPEFDFATKNLTHISLSYYESTNYKFGKIGAYDQDEGPNGTLQFSIQNGDPAMKFYLDPINGDLRLAKKLTSLDIQDYDLTIEAKDMGTPPRSNTIKITVKVDNSPPVGHQNEGYSHNVDSLNLYIIIAIVVASFVISIVLLVAICIVLQKSRIRNQSQPNKFNYVGALQQENNVGLGDLSIANYHIQHTNLSRTASINLFSSVPDNVMDTESYLLSNRDQAKFDTTPNDFYRIGNSSYQPLNMEEIQTNNDKDSGKGDSVDARVLYHHLDHGKLYGIFDGSIINTGTIPTSRMINNGMSYPYDLINNRRPPINYCQHDNSNHRNSTQTSSNNSLLCNIDSGSFV